MKNDNTSIESLCEDISEMFKDNGVPEAIEKGEEIDWNDICR